MRSAAQTMEDQLDIVPTRATPSIHGNSIYQAIICTVVDDPQPEIFFYRTIRKGVRDRESANIVVVNMDARK